jgi:hypothetical protein
MLEGWEATISYGVPQFGPGDHPKGNARPVGRALIGELGRDELLVTGFFCRVSFRPAGALAGKAWQYLCVEEGQYENGVFKPIRIWNGDQTDWGLNFASAPQVLRVTLYTR